MTQIQQCISQTYNHTSQLQQYSGKYFYRLGRYQQCIKLGKQMDYYFVEITYIGSGYRVSYFGLCLPAICDNNTVQAIINHGLGQVDLPLYAVSVTNKLQQSSYPYTWATYFAIFTLLSLISLVIYATIKWKKTKTVTQQSQQQSIINYFSIQQSSKIFTYSYKQSSSQLNIFNGIRALSMLWVIFGHLTTFITDNISNYMTIMDGILDSWKFLPLKGAYYAVDIFFMIGGFMLGYSFLKYKYKSKLKYILAILNRILRIAPVYYFTFLIYYGLTLHVRSDVFYKHQSYSIKTCSQSYIYTLLFVDNIINPNRMCMSWCWYLHADIQLFIFCLAVLAVYNRYRIIGFFIIFTCLIANFAYVGYTVYEIQQKWVIDQVNGFNSRHYVQYIYNIPWSRASPYLYGLLLGIMYHQFIQYQQINKVNNVGQQNEKNNNQVMSTNSQAGKVQNNSKQISKKQQRDVSRSKKAQTLIIQQKQQKLVQKQSKALKSRPFMLCLKQYYLRHPWHRRLSQLFGLFLILFIEFIPRTIQGVPQQQTWPQQVHCLLYAFGPITLVMGVSLMILPSILLPITAKYQKNPKNPLIPINSTKIHNNLLIRYILDTKAFNFLTKISFGSYLVHAMYMQWYLASMKFDFYYTFNNVIVMSTSLAVICVISGVGMVFLVEAPFAKLQKRLISKIMGKTMGKNGRLGNQAEKQRNQANIGKQSLGKQKVKKYKPQ